MAIEKNYSLFTLLLIAAGHFIIDFYLEILPPLMPTIMDKIGFSMTLAGLLFTVNSIASSWSQPLFGYLGDRHRWKYVLPVSILWITLLMGSVGIANTFPLLLFITTLAGLGSAVYHPLGSVAAASFTSEYRGFVTSAYVTVGILGSTMAPLAAIKVKEWGGLEGLYVIAVPGVILAVFLALQIRSHSTEDVGGKEVSAATEDSNDGSDGGGSPISAFKDISGMRWLFLLMAIMSLRAWAIRAFTVFIPTYYFNLGMEEVFGARVLSMFLFSQGVGGVVGGLCADRIGRKQTIFYTCALSIAFLLGFFYSSGVLSLVLLWAGGAALNSAFPVSVVFAQEVNPKNQNFASGVMIGLTFGIGGLGALFTGSLTDLFGGNLNLALKTNIIALIVSLVITSFLPSDRKPA